MASALEVAVVRQQDEFEALHSGIIASAGRCFVHTWAIVIKVGDENATAAQCRGRCIERRRACWPATKLVWAAAYRTLTCIPQNTIREDIPDFPSLQIADTARSLLIVVAVLLVIDGSRVLWASASWRARMKWTLLPRPAW